MRITVSISLANHNASICILKNNKIDLFIQIERLNRKKHSAELNIDAFNIIKKHVNYIDDLILVNFFDESKINLTIETLNKIVKLNDIIVDDDNHHLYHAASAFYLSGFKKATCLVIDGWGTLLNIDNFYGSETSGVRARKFVTDNEAIRYTGNVSVSNVYVGVEFDISCMRGEKSG
jgi:predicted NodU family carbamoyl transferase